jgi:hypothetical protein
MSQEQEERTHPAQMPDRPLPCPPHPTTIPRKGGDATHPLLHRPTLNLSTQAGSLQGAQEPVLLRPAGQRHLHLLHGC